MTDFASSASIASSTGSIELITLISFRQEAMNITDHELAAALGYANESVITAMKAGKMQVPVTKVPALAKALNIRATELLRSVLAVSAPEILAVIDSVLGPLNLTKSEANLIKHCRKLSAGREGGPLVFDGRSLIALIAV